MGRVEYVNVGHWSGTIMMAGCRVTISKLLEAVGVTIDSGLIFDNHVSDVVKSYNHYNKTSVVH